MLPQEIIRVKRDGGTLTATMIEEFVVGVTSGAVSEGQVAAFAMAVFWRGMSVEECVALTTAMTHSGTQLSWDLDGPVVDKHSTGGVGDTVSLMLAPMVAACGAFVPMISGRGLGHTGGTFDKMDSIPRYRTTPDMDELRAVVGRIGCAIIGQTADLAPADRRIYGVRDVTATVESIPLITASILSKKLAAGLDALVMDVKVGEGAFMRTEAEANELARTIVDVATGAGVPTVALLTDMDQPLGSVAGNALEVIYAIDYLTGRHREPRMHDVVVALCAEMLVLAGQAPDIAAAAQRLEGVLADGSAAERFQQMVAALGGPADLVEHPQRHLATAAVTLPVVAGVTGTVGRIDTRSVGLAVVTLGGGRTRPQDPVDHAVGLTELLAVGERVEPDTPLAIVHARTLDDAEAAARIVSAAYSFGEPHAEPVRRGRVAATA